MSSAAPISQACSVGHAPKEEACFHCGLSIPEDTRLPEVEVLGEPRHFCCSGCYAVCEAIVDSGLEDYYRFRTDKARSGNTADIVPGFLERLEIYDRPEVQKGFVRSIAKAVCR